MWDSRRRRTRGGGRGAGREVISTSSSPSQRQSSWPPKVCNRRRRPPSRAAVVFITSADMVHVVDLPSSLDETKKVRFGGPSVHRALFLPSSALWGSRATANLEPPTLARRNGGEMFRPCPVSRIHDVFLSKGSAARAGRGTAAHPIERNRCSVQSVFGQRGAMSRASAACLLPCPTMRSPYVK